MKKIFILLIIVLQYSTYAQHYWSQANGPYGGKVDNLSQGKNGVIYVGMENGGVYRSTDNGNNWSRLGLAGMTIRDIIETGSGFIIALTDSGLYRTTDNGLNWSNTYSGRVQSIAMSPNGQVFLVYFNSIAVGEYGIKRSTDEGATWESVNNDLPDLGRGTTKIAISPVGTIFVSTEYGLLVKSTNNGQNWIQINKSQIGNYILTMAINANEQIFVGTASGTIYQFVDTSFSGGYWKKTGFSVQYEPYVNDLAINGNGNILAGTDEGTYLSNNNGKTWSQLTAESTIAVLYDPAANIFIGTYGELLQSVDEGKTWTTKMTGITCSNISMIAMGTDGTLYAGANVVLSASTDNGANWTQVHSFEGTIKSLTVLSNRRILVGHKGLVGTYYSDDYGNTWIQSDTMGLPQSYFRSFLQTRNGIVFGGTGHGLYKSTDYGFSWKAAGLESKSIGTLVESANGYIFAGTYNEGLYYSTDSGNTWEQISFADFQNTSVVPITVLNNGVLLVTAYVGLYRSTDNGITWTNVSNPPMKNNQYVTISSFVTTADGDLFGNFNGSVYWSTDAGDTWKELNDGIENLLIRNLAVTQDGHLLATAAGNGLYISSTTIHNFPHDFWKEVQLCDVYGLHSLVENKNGIIFAATYSEIYRSSNGGKNWENTGFSGNVFDKELYTTSTGDILACTGSGIIYRSTDNGTSWGQTVIGIPNNNLVENFSYSESGKMFVELYDTTSGVKELHLSTDNGVTWKLSSSILKFANISYLKTHKSGLCFASTNQGLYRSTDDGENWSLSTNGLPGGIPIGTIEYLANGNIFAGTLGEGIFKSTDGGITWSQTAFNTFDIYSIVQNKNGQIFAGTGGNGVYYSNDYGVSWKDISSGLKDKYIYDLLVTNNEGLIAVSYRSVYIAPGTVTGVKEKQERIIPSYFILKQNYPNPFNPTTTINYSVPKAGLVTIKVYDALGREIETLVNEEKLSGNYKVEFNGNKLSSGIYFYRMQARNFVETKKLILLK